MSFCCIEMLLVVIKLILKGASYIGIGATIDIQTRFVKEDWGNYDLTNDHSINSGTEYADWKKVNVFVDGVKVWGKDWASH